MTKFIYLRSVRSQSPIGCLAYVLDPKTSTASYQVSVLNPTPYFMEGGKTFEVAGRQRVTRDRLVKDQFNRADARQIAASKLVTRPIICPINFGNNPSPWEIMSCIMAHLSLIKRKDIPNRASKEASNWMRANGFKKMNKNWVVEFPIL